MKTLALSAIILAEKEKIPGHGEDAYAYYFGSENNGYFAVFDGCGGMGAKRYYTIEEHTGAYIGSRVSAFVTNDLYLSDSFSLNENDPVTLHNELTAAFSKLKSNYKEEQSNALKGRMFKEFPTTAVICIVQCYQDEFFDCEIMWAGDSRGYILNQQGIAQITDDDVMTDEDAFSDLRNDAKLKNTIYAGDDFYINSRIIQLQNPVIIIAATDGAFGYLPTPMHFEHLILDSMICSDNPEEWKNEIEKRISEVTGDDFTFAAAVLGFDSWEETKEYFAERHSYVQENYIIPCENATDQMKESLWKSYKDNYYRW